MLKEVSVKNYKSFKNEILFSMEADSKLSELKSHLYENSFGDKLLKVSSIYGPNAGGKSNLLRAIYFLKYLEAYSEMINSGENEHLFYKSVNFEKYISPFKFDNGNNIINYSIFFIDDQYELGYNIVVDIDILKGKSFILEEHFSFKTLGDKEYFDVFNREVDNINSNKLLSEIGIEQFRISDNMPFLFYLYKNFVNKNIDNTKNLSLIKRFMDQLNSIKLINGIDNVNQSQIIKTLKENKDIKKDIIEILNSLDISIDDIVFEKNEEKEEIYFVHNINNKKGKLTIHEESEGTVCLISLLSKIINCLKYGGILLCDELDSHLHPKLVAKIIELFTSEHNKNCQLIFNSHDIWNMNSDNFRRDEIWFVFRDKYLVSEVVSLNDYVGYDGKKIRKDVKYSKQYMEGKFGADPFIIKGVVWDGKQD